ncbi:PepSY-associated TM helix domain-containing protein [Microbacterium thalli]|uniref:PepSY-associated TM helix domain-containing protein n=1 Tax=Microbacterium thalli TaxID=3027921 RepID=A0ABT5SFB5_9MICO|nr:PepSY-associated TM helix domain-containing protein [Microbacterium thalli]MDD7961500.1 PepSY-associated TM helix domain-containing protein [Microbacterium thalli]
MSITDERPTGEAAPDPAGDAAGAPPREHAPPRRTRPWLVPLLLRIHFYAGILVGPFILIAAVSGALYVLTPAVERVVYAHELRAPVSQTSLSLGEQVRIAEGHIGDAAALVAVRPAPEPGDTTRVMFAQDGLGASETRAVFIDPGTGEIRGDHTVYGTSGALPLRTWVDQLHRSLNLGEPGRLYSELAASWLGVVVLAGLGLWIARLRTTRAKRDLVRPRRGATGYRRLFGWHASLGVWLVLGAVFLSASGITWSTYGGANVSSLRAALSWQAPALETTLGDGAGAADPHADHGVVTAPSAAVAPETFDAVFAVARTENVDVGAVEIRPPSAAGQAWVVQEIQRSFPTQVDAVSIDGESLAVVDRVDFADYPVMAKLARWAVDLHMGTMFGLVNQIVLFVVASGIAAMVVLGYAMWWKCRPTRDAARGAGSAPAEALPRAPLWGIALVVAVAIVIGFLLPLLGITLALFVIGDAVVQAVRLRPRDAAPDARTR